MFAWPGVYLFPPGVLSKAVMVLLRGQVAGAHVSAPLGRPRGIVHFIGGAFAGAAPQLLYPLLIELLTEAGYTVISTPFAVTFKHLECAQLVHQVCATVTACALARCSPTCRREVAGPWSNNICCYFEQRKYIAGGSGTLCTECFSA